jgi:hypothetical protein
MRSLTDTDVDMRYLSTRDDAEAAGYYQPEGKASTDAHRAARRRMLFLIRSLAQLEKKRIAIEVPSCHDRAAVVVAIVGRYP